MQNFEKLVDIVAKLRGEGGCPWDRKQTVESLIPKLVEEAEEVRLAVENGDRANLEEEVGDVLLNILMITEIAQETGDFTLDSLMQKLIDKIISRHTWVFGDEKAATAEEALALWTKNKEKEKAKKDHSK